MPKRRLGYREIGITNENAAPSPSAQQPSTDEKHSSRRSSSSRKSSDFLSKLAKSCQQHSANCHKYGKTAVRLDTEEGPIPDQCRSDMEKLRNLLPEIEKKFRPPAKGERGPEAYDVANLCDFYNSAMQGTYCPYAPHLFLTGKSVEDVISRVHFLLRHLVSPAVLAAAKEEAVFSDADDASSPPPVLWTLSQTIAHLLSFLLSSSIYSLVVMDLVMLLEDCCFLLEESDCLPVNLALFDGTLDFSALEFDCSLDLNHADQVWILRVAMTMTLGTFLVDLGAEGCQSQFGLSLQNTHSTVSPLLSTGSLDLHVRIANHGTHSELFAALFGSIRHVLLSNCPGGIGETLFFQGKLAAAILLRELVSDSTHLAPQAGSFKDCAMLVTSAISATLRSDTEAPVEYLDVLGELLRQVVVEPPAVAGSPFSMLTSNMAAQSTVHPLLDCIPGISRHAPASGTSLDLMILSSIQLFLECDDEKKHTISYCLANGIIPCLLVILEDSRLKSTAVALLSRILYELAKPDECNKAFQAAIDFHKNPHEGADPEGNTTAKDNGADPNGTEKPSARGTKRKRQTTTSSTDARSPIRALVLSPSKNPATCRLRSSSLHCWISALREVLYKAMQSTTILMEEAAVMYNDPTTIRVNTAMRIIDDKLPTIASALSLTSMLIFRYMTSGIDATAFSAISAIGQRLVEAMERACNALMDNDTPLVDNSDVLAYQIIIDAALDLHYSGGKLLINGDGPFCRKCLAIILAASNLAQNLLVRDESYTEAGIRSYQTLEPNIIANREKSLVSRTDLESFFTWRNSFLRQPASLNENLGSATFRRSMALEALHASPIGTKSSLLWSLYPCDDDVQESLCKLDDSKFAKLDRLLKALLEQHPRQKISSSSRIAALFTLPRCVQSFTLLFGNRAGQEARRLVTVKILADFIGPLCKSLVHTETALCNALLSVVIRLDDLWTVNFTTVDESRYSVFEAAKDISIRTFAPATIDGRASPPSLEVDIEFKRCTHVLSSKIPEDHPDHYVRKLRWYLLAKSALRSSRSEIRANIHPTGFPLENEQLEANSGFDFGDKPPLVWLLESPFMDEDRHFREATSRELRHLVLSENEAFLLSHFSSPEDLQVLASRPDRSTVQESFEFEHATESVASNFFHCVDKMLHNSIGVSDSQLSFTIANSVGSSAIAQRKQQNRLPKERTAIKLLGLFCSTLRPRHSMDRVFYEKAYQRLVRIWAAGSQPRMDDFAFSTSKALAFAEISRAALLQATKDWWKCSSQYAATVISDVLVLNCNASREIQFLQVETFAKAAMVLDQTNLIANSRSVKSVREYVEDNLPTIISQFIEEKSTDLLRTMPAFQLFLDERVRRMKKQSTGEKFITGGTNAPEKWKHNSAHMSIQDLDKRVLSLFESKSIVDRVLPLIFMRVDRSGLSFFTKQVLKGTTISGLMKGRDRMILKSLAWELGREPENIGPARIAIRTSAVARNLEQNAGAASLERERSPDSDVEAAKTWVTSHFMFLLVSVVQFRWKTRSFDERLCAVRCLHSLLDFLVASEAPQYFPQVMATVNAAILDAENYKRDIDQNNIEAAFLRLYAVKTLSKFIRLVAEVQVDTISSSLATVVVALIPVLDDQGSEKQSGNMWREARDVAVSVLEFLTTGNLGRSLAEHFKDVPFLPLSQSLETVHRSLRSNGVDFDNLAVLSSTTQHAATASKEASAADVSATMSDVVSNRSEKMPALHNRLSLISRLLENESANVRKVALQHLTDLLRANRETFLGLVHFEGSLSGRRFLTVEFQDETGNVKWASRGAVTKLVEALLARCVAESDDEVRRHLATCIGEVGAISETRLGEITIGSSMGDEAIDSPTSSYKWRLDQAPWQSQAVKYELQLVSRHLVAALKAAPSSSDQHKVAFSIQQLLHLLNSQGNQSEPVGAESGPPDPEKMTKWLKEQLAHSGQLDFIEPYFSSDFQEKNPEASSEKRPPFFRFSAGYFTWMSNFCRWMIQGLHKSDPSPWRDMLFACRTAVRTEAGSNVAEFILPLLVLDRLCCGTAEDFLLIRQEVTDVLQMKTKVFMDEAGKQRAVNAVFTMVDTLRSWADREVEERSKGRSSANSSSRTRRQASSRIMDCVTSNNWPASESIEKISEFLSGLPLRLQAKAAKSLGMNARALQRLELEAREATTVHVFEKSKEEQRRETERADKLATYSVPAADLDGIDLMKTILSRLDDCETMVALGKDSMFFNPLQQIRDSIREKEASEDHEAALQEYERALQASDPLDRDQSFIEGSLRCLMELGRYESILNQAGGLQRTDNQRNQWRCLENTPFAVEAAWKLGRWETLSDLVEVDSKRNLDLNERYEVLKGKAMLGLQTQNQVAVSCAINHARDRVMQDLSSLAAESYARSYRDIVRLQSLREIENANDLTTLGEHSRLFDLEEIAQSTAVDGWAWKSRTDVTTTGGALSIIATRVALARIDSNAVLSGSLYLEGGHRARKNGKWTISENLLSQAQAAVAGMIDEKQKKTHKLFQLVYSTQEQLAKLRYAKGECSSALRILGHQGVGPVLDAMLSKDDDEAIAQLAVECEKRLIHDFSGMTASNYEDDAQLKKKFAGRLLKLTRWVSEVGLEGGLGTLSRFQLIQKLAPDWEKGHFYYGKFVDSMLQARVAAIAGGTLGRDSSSSIDENEMRNNVLLRDNTCQSYIILAMTRYASALKMDTKHVYQALPRLLSLWFDLASLARDKADSKDLENLRAMQEEANKFMANQVKVIPPVAFYTVMPQLISRVIHDDEDTSMVVRSILLRVLVKFPQQAMWPLAWLQGSKIDDRKQIGKEIFENAKRQLARSHKAMSKLVGASESLFDFLRDLAIKQGSPDRPNSNRLDVAPWYDADVDLSEFLPPIQAALAMTPTSTEHPHSTDHFAPDVPRMRTFSHRIGVMSSKARPKRVKAFAVAGTYKAPPRSQRASTSGVKTYKEEVDVGEIHFLVKQEAKGDLRKDARVQDLNSVINRLMTSNNGESGVASRRRRRLRLRTFAVTCLSEDIGVLEWVPNTDSLRSLVTSSYNPQTSPNCTRRRGNRLANFGDATLRSHYEMCQNKYFKEGNLSKAAALFEDNCLRPYPPVLYWWFIQRFHDPHAWYEARKRFTLSAAAWSAVGHVIGLGDRHSENILIDTSNGECVHVDFDCIFDKGLNLPRPEVVPFRLTANMVDVFGPTGADGVYTTGMQTAMRTLRNNRDTLLSVLEPFLKDPVIDWKRHRNQQNKNSAANQTGAQIHSDKQAKEAKRSIKVIDERLQGIYNLRNPNLKKYRRRDRATNQDNDDYAHLVPLPVEGQVQRMIQEATSHENLVQLYVGWMPWL